MRIKTLGPAFLAIVFPLLFVSLCRAEEQVTITTYYPAPNGVYMELRADQMSVGSGYRARIIGNGILIVQDNLGIGTYSPGSRFEVNMGDALGNPTNDYFRVNQDLNVGIQLHSGTSAGQPYIDLSRDASAYDVRLYLTNLAAFPAPLTGISTYTMGILGNVYVTGLIASYQSAFHPGGCVLMSFGTNSGVTTCPSGTHPDLTLSADPAVGGYMWCCS